MIFEGTKNQFFFGLELTRAGETVPDIEKCDRLAKFYDITIDALLHQENTVGNTRLAPAPPGKHLWGTVTIGSKGQIVIPKDVRDIFNLNSGDRLIVLGDETEGIALVKAEEFEEKMREIVKKKVMKKSLVYTKTGEARIVYL